ncbi:valine--tRNA ligase [Methylocapsa acidiphila]|uniref:valine--tRNA ligase n=1 Tax=Methylocapsa acidiphila TaxID=133552 RepID=UPI00047997C5|nr:valine--tRNA ligase [Methylocapsa acidiphila]
MMEKTFDPATVEARIADAWREAEAFRAGRPDRHDAAPFTIVIPPPNVTGSLHMGHALNNSLQDILCRFERMRGRDVLWQPGMDHAGIATQMVVERQLMERQEPDRRTMGRERFLARVWEWKAESGGAIAAQLQRLGASCDWSRERFTLDEGLSRAVAKVFVQLYKEGLIYKDKRLVNWDPKLLTAISDLEVVQIETKGHLWHFKYPVVDDAGAETGEFITVATTRPETMLGDSGVAVHPDDPRYKHLHGARVRLPLVGRLIPIVADEYSDPEKGTGAVKITPAHDFNDFEVGRRRRLALINIFNAEAKLSLQENDEFLLGLDASADAGYVLDNLHGLSREAARRQIIELMNARGLLEKIEPHPHTVPHGDRSGAIIEPWLTDQWYVDAKTLAEPALEAVRAGHTSFIPKNWEKTYFEWLENIQPWCVSRQLWWGHQIPAWYGPDGKVFVEISETEAEIAALAHYGAPTNLIRDEDVLDTWFSSALWPFSTLGWPDKTPELGRHYPTNVLITGFDIIFFWVARMMMMGLHFMGEVPFRDVYIHALVRDEKGAKMSKSKGNVIDPLNLIEQYGADSLRFTLAAMAAQGRDIKLSTQRVEGYRNFATKLWNAARFAEMNGCARVDGFDPRGVAVTLNQWILGETAKAVGEVSAAIEAYRFNDAANAVYRFVWNIFCDWHLELAKPLLLGADPQARDETRATTAFVFDAILKLLHPFMPFITEELWAIKGAEGPPRQTLLTLAPWPQPEDCQPGADKAAEAETEIGWLIDLVSEIRSARSEINVPAGAQIPLVLIPRAEDSGLEGRALRWEETIKRLARVSNVAFSKEAPEKSVQLIVRGALAALPLEGVIDFAAEKARLAKEIAKLKGEAAKIEAKLGNADFVARAPEEVVEENRERLAEARARTERLEAALATLGGA